MDEFKKNFMVHSDFSGTLTVEKDECIYNSCYCEENIYKLCEQINNHSCGEVQKCYAVFVSNEMRRVPLWYQKAGNGPEKLVFWDYHVFLVFKDYNESLVYDFDTCLPFPTSSIKYFTMTFKYNRFIDNSRAMFRVIEAPIYLKKFSSDRSHMKKGITGDWMKDPPEYPAIISSDAESSHDLDSFISMDPNVGCGKVMKLSELIAFFTSSSEDDKR